MKNTVTTDELICKFNLMRDLNGFYAYKMSSGGSSGGGAGGGCGGGMGCCGAFVWLVVVFLLAVLFRD